MYMPVPSIFEPSLHQAAIFVKQEATMSVQPTSNQVRAGWSCSGQVRSCMLVIVLLAAAAAAQQPGEAAVVNDRAKPIVVNKLASTQ